MENTVLNNDIPQVGSGQYAGKTALERQAVRRKQLIEAAIELAGAGGQPAATVNAICAKAGLTKRYFYESFTSRDQLISAAYAVIGEELKQQVAAALEATVDTPNKMSEASLTTLFNYVGDNRSRGRLLMLEILGFSDDVSRAYDVHVQNFADLLLEINAPLMPNNAPRKELRDLATRGAIGAICYLAQRWISSNYQQPIEELVEASQLLLNGLKQQFGIQL